MRRLLAPVALGSLALVLSACGSGDATFPGSGGTQTSAGGAAAPALTCEDPPTAPSDVPTFSQDDLPEPLSGDPTTLTATLETNCGDIVLELDAAKAPQTVASFEFLAGQGYWDHSACHRLTTQGIFVLQCGDPTGTGRGNPGYGYGIENAPADGRYPAGTLAMARTQDPGSNGGQFFIVYEDTQLPVQGGGYSIFGRVTQGLDIVQAVAAQGGRSEDPNGSAPAQPISILSVDVG
ncbi:peptidylprolyl isomerase [Ornithinimicrobium avium]|uniref:Peptidylprolyl isomerase n=1 Tax=Ornithinimicrobium avium TaxID=2283195 RepID=A0A345NJT2_9MICO|nr:peptidylprolyl isomerase [Ornithinimicrobium avium]AXH95290.1 peptidylprolyl isomerase [Ornithinimicrobium avium]